MRTMILKCLVGFSVCLLATMESQAQSVDVNNEVEYSSDHVDDMNSISIPTKRVRRKVKQEDTEISEADLKDVAERAISVRYRKKRHASGGKCFKQAVAHTSCNSKKIDKLLKKATKKSRK